MIAGMEGRTLKIRPTVGGTGVQLGIVGKRGSLVEAFCADLAAVGPLIGTINSAAEAAEEELAAVQIAAPGDLLGALARAETLARAEEERNATHCPEGHELTPENSYERRPGVKGCRKCRRASSGWRREGDRLIPRPAIGR